MSQEAHEWSELSRTHLCEASLRLLAALGREPCFPDDVPGLEALVGRVAEGRPGEPMDFAVEPAGELPRYSGEYVVWLSPAAAGCLRLRHERGESLESEAVTLRPDGRLGAFETIAGFGLPEAELTDQARADRETVERRAHELEAQEKDIGHDIDESQRRFRTEHLLRVLGAPQPQDPTGPVVSFVALYETGLIVYYLVPRPPEEELESDDPWAEPLEAAMMPRIELSDGQGTAYEVADLDYLEPNASLLRGSQSFTPAVPANAAGLTIRFESTGVTIELGSA